MAAIRKTSKRARSTGRPAERAPRRRARRASSDIQVSDLLRRHFAGIPAENLRVSERKFPFRVRADLQRTVESIFGSESEFGRVLGFYGIRKPHAHEGVDFASLLTTDPHYPAVVVPAHYEDVDVGEEQAVRCLHTGLWLLEQDGIRFAVLLAPDTRYGEIKGVKLMTATPDTSRGLQIADSLFRAMETAMLKARSYRGKVLSLEQDHDYRGRSTGIKVHRLAMVAREQVILPDRTLELLERNVLQFVRRRARLSEYGQATKKGLLFYGPPGTGKSHTIQYLAGALEGHTTLLITAEQVGLLDEYVTLARLLQPSVVVIEDVDLVARNREHRHGPCDEALLNRLLNEMDGLRESADILFILTTNRPSQIEPALASRPGRVDQAIEFPLPDAEGRRKLVELYSGQVPVPQGVVAEIVRRTQNVSAAFIKELMRRSVQFLVERQECAGTGDGEGISVADVDNALNEMLFIGGSLNAKLLGAAAPAPVDGGGELADV